MPHCPVLHVYGLPAGIFRELLEQRLPGREIRGFADESAFAAEIAQVEMLLAHRPPPEFWKGAARLQLIQMVGAGVDSLLPAVDLPPQVRIANARGVHASQMSEYALAMMLHFARRMSLNLEQQCAHQWQMYAPSLLDGATCGILGLGAIGEAVAMRARNFGMRVIATRNHPRPSPHADEVLGMAESARVLRESDYVVIVLPLTHATRGCLGKSLLSQMKPEAVLVNMARGGIVDEAALATMLREERLRGAALDVFEQEPLAESSPLWDVPNLVVTPHVAGFSRQYLPNVFDIFLDNVERLEAGKALRNPVDRERGY